MQILLDLLDVKQTSDLFINILTSLLVIDSIGTESSSLFIIHACYAVFIYCSFEIDICSFPSAHHIQHHSTYYSDPGVLMKLLTVLMIFFNFLFVFRLEFAQISYDLFVFTSDVLMLCS